MTPEEFRSAGHLLVDWIADHRAGLAQLPVQATTAPGQIASQLPAEAPELPDEFADVLADLERIIVPGVTHVNHPRYFGWFPANSSLSSISMRLPRSS